VSLRIIAGTARGRPLAAPKGDVTRPTSDKVRAAIFNILGQFFEGGRVLDLYSGTGALALEALSRGMSDGVAVDKDRLAVAIIEKNAEACGMEARLEVMKMAVEAALPRIDLGRFQLVFIDPPYAMGPQQALRMLGSRAKSGLTVVAEHHKKEAPDDIYGNLKLDDRRSFGDTGVSIYRAE
jgi:16S rRNA (guanine966-N2)-methyltransferase